MILVYAPKRHAAAAVVCSDSASGSVSIDYTQAKSIGATPCALPISANAAQILADEAATTEHLLTGKPLDPEIYRRVRARTEQITAELRRRHGDMGLAVDLIRDSRDE